MRLILTLAALAGLAGCGLMSKDTCPVKQPYESAGSAAPLRAAEGLPPANTKNALKIPEVAAAKPRKAGDACLDRPPPFYADRPKPPAPK